MTAATPAQPAEAAPDAEETLISIDDFARIDLRIVEVVAAEAVAKADKLLKLTVKLGDEERRWSAASASGSRRKIWWGARWCWSPT